nr:DUF4236 domain-containing protein [Phenylobacterium glaciei]
MNFFKRLRLIPHVWLNLSRGGPSVTAGKRGLKATMGKRGTTLTAGLPGTGLSISQRIGKQGAKPKSLQTGQKLLEKVLRSKGSSRP